MTRYWFDWEFMEDGTLIEPLSIGMVCEDGREFYAENSEADWDHANEWVVENVLPHLAGPGNPWWMTKAQIADHVLGFVTAGWGTPEFWGYYADYDWVALCQLYGRMVDLPDGWPKFCMDIKQLAVDLGNPTLPAQTGVEHNAMADARWNRQAWEFLQREKKAKAESDRQIIQQWRAGHDDIGV